MVKIRSSDFKEEHLRLGDVWTWSRELTESEDSLVAVPLTEDALSEADSLLVRADFRTAQGDVLRGLVMYAMGTGSVFAIEILSGSESFTLNAAARELSRGELNRLAGHLKKDPATLLPIAYTIAPKALAIPPGTYSL